MINGFLEVQMKKGIIGEVYQFEGIPSRDQGLIASIMGYRDLKCKIVSVDYNPQRPLTLYVIAQIEND